MEETFLCLDYKREGLKKYIHIGMISIITVYLLFTYMREPNKIFLLFLTSVAVIILFMLVYFPSFQRKRRCRNIHLKDKVFQISIPQSGIVKAFESENVFTIQSKEEVYCIPKRILDRSQRNELREHMTKSAVIFLNIKTGRGRLDA